MSTIRCKNCSGHFDAKLSYCPYCGSMNKRGAYAEFRGKISSLIDSMLGLKENVEKSVSRMIFSALLRSLVIIILIIGIAFAFSRTAKVNYRNDPKYDQQAYEEITWMNDNLDKLNEAYESGDYKAVEKLYYQEPNAVRTWSRYPSYALKLNYQKIKDEDRFDAYHFQRMLHLIFFPECFTGYNGMSRVDQDEYAEMRDDLIAELEERGYSLSELEDIYEKCADSYGFADSDLLKQYMKEGGNG